jgi:hypothetical protein
MRWHASISIHSGGRLEEKKWALYTFGPGEEIRLESLDIQFAFDDVYEDINFDNSSQEEDEGE